MHYPTQIKEGIKFLICGSKQSRGMPLFLYLIEINKLNEHDLVESVQDISQMYGKKRFNQRFKTDRIQCFSWS